MSDPRKLPPQQGDEAELFERYDERLHRAVARWIVTSPSNVDDACAYAWSKLLTHQPRRDTVFAWLTVVGRNHALRLHERERIYAGEIELDVHDDDGAAVRSMEATMLTRHLVEPLPPRQREAVLLRALGWTREEAAERLGISLRMLDHALTAGTATVRDLSLQEPVSGDGAPLRVQLLLELQARPPEFLRSAIGRAPTAKTKKGRVEMRRAWSRVALAIIDYRARHGITDPVDALGPPRIPREPAREELEQRIVDYNTERRREHEHRRGLSR